MAGGGMKPVFIVYKRGAVVQMTADQQAGIVARLQKDYRPRAIAVKGGNGSGAARRAQREERDSIIARINDTLDPGLSDRARAGLIRRQWKTTPAPSITTIRDSLSRLAKDFGR